MFLCGISTRSFSVILLRLPGRKISPAEVSEANRERVEAVQPIYTRRLTPPII
jgi:transposase-like protein